MILVTVGGDIHPFPRLIKGVKGLIDQNKIHDEVILQTGHTKIKIENCEWFDFIDMDKFEKLIEQSNIIITHAGAGTIMTALRSKKPIIVVPRMKKYNEHINDHQLQLAKALAEQGKVIPLYEINKLEKAVEMATKFKPKYAMSAKGEIIKTIKAFCEIIDNENSHT